MSEFEDRLREIAREIGRSVERNIDDVAETFGVDPERARNFAQAAGQWINEHVEAGEELFGGERASEPAPTREPVPTPEPASAREPAVAPTRAVRRGPHPLDRPTEDQGMALSALDSGRWTVRPGSNALTGSGEGADPVPASELVSELRARDWIKANGELTLVGRRALGRWCDTAERPPAPPRFQQPAAPLGGLGGPEPPASDASPRHDEPGDL